MKKSPSKVGYLSKIVEFLVHPKLAMSAKTDENSHGFLNVSYTCYKSLTLPSLSDAIEKVDSQTDPDTLRGEGSN